MKVFNFVKDLVLGIAFTGSLVAGVLTLLWLISAEMYGGLFICLLGGILYAVYSALESKNIDPYQESKEHKSVFDFKEDDRLHEIRVQIALGTHESSMVGHPATVLFGNEKRSVFFTFLPVGCSIETKIDQLQKAIPMWEDKVHDPSLPREDKQFYRQVKWQAKRLLERLHIANFKEKYN